MPGKTRRQERYALPAMGQTRVDLQHLLEDLRDAYPDAIEETILWWGEAVGRDRRRRQPRAVSRE